MTHFLAPRSIGREASPAETRSPLSKARAPTRAGFSDLQMLQAGSAIFLAPDLLFAAALKDYARAATLLGGFAALFVVLRQPKREGSLLAARVDLPLLALLAALSVGLMLLGGATHLFAPNADWQIRDAVLADVTLRGLPALYRFGDADYFLRAPLGMYLTPAFVGRAFGLYAAHLAMFAQNAALLSLILYFFVQLANAPKFAFVLVFAAFGWADQLIQFACLLTDRGGWWNPFYFRYMSTLTNLFWAPNHTLPGLWAAVLALLLARREIDLATAGVSLTALLLWSPFAVIGGAPFLVFLALREKFAALIAPRLVVGVLASLCFLPVALYLSLDTAHVAQRGLAAASGFWGMYFAFLAVELPRAGIFYAGWSKIDRSDRALLLLCVVVLACIPFYSLGPFNDFSMRVSQPALALVAFGFARIAATTPRDGKALSVAVLALTSFTAIEAMFELRFPLVTPSYPISDCGMATAIARQNRGPASDAAAPAHYMAPVALAPAWLGTLGGEPSQDERKQCWPKGS